MNNILHIGDKIDTSKSVENVFRVTLLPLDIFDFWERCSAFSVQESDFYCHQRIGGKFSQVFKKQIAADRIGHSETRSPFDDYHHQLGSPASARTIFYHLSRAF
jgi:hypothetical protein